MLTQARLKELLHYNRKTGIFTWRLTRGRTAKKGATAGWQDGSYWRVEVDHKTYRAHRLAWLYVHGVWPCGDLDHKDTNGLNNAISNLRCSPSPSFNAQNRRRPRPGSESGFIGVNLSRSKWRAQISYGGRNRHLGLFDTPEQAHAAYVKAKRIHHEGGTL